MKKSVFSAALAVILLAGCAQSENSSAESSQSSSAAEGSSSAVQSTESSQSTSGAESSSSSTKTSSSSSSLSSSSAAVSSGAAQSTESSQSSSGAKSSSSSKPAQSSSKASSSKPAQSSSQKPVQSSSSKPASSSATESKPAVSTGKLAPENNPLPDYKYIEDPDAKGAIVYGIRTNDPKQGTYTPTDVSNLPPEAFKENGFPYPNAVQNEVFVDKNGVKWVYSAVTDWYIDGTEPDVSHEAAPGFGGGQIPGAY